MLKKRATFFRQIFKKGNKNGSITPSSIFLCRKMIERIDFRDAKCIVELGPGEGAITREILKKMGPKTQLFLFEMNKEFVEEFLHFEDPRVHVVNDSAEHFAQYTQSMGFEKVDYIISSLPLSLFPEELREKIIDESQKALRQRGLYVQYMYFTNMADFFKRKFKLVKREFVPLNIPPAMVYTCLK